MGTILGADPRALITTTTPTEFLKSSHGIVVQGTIISTAVDAAATPTTSLMKGLTMAIITASGLYSQYDNGNADGTEDAVGLLMDDVNMLDETGTAMARVATFLVHGRIDSSLCNGWDAAAAVDLKGAISII